MSSPQNTPAKPGHGGSRPGSGRKPGGGTADTKVLSVRIGRAYLEAFKAAVPVEKRRETVQGWIVRNCPQP